MENIFTQILSEIVIPIVALILSTVATILLVTIKNKYASDDLQKRLLDSMISGVAEVKNSFVKGAKEAAADGHLSKDEIRRAQEGAFNIAKKISDPDVQRVLEKLTHEQVSGLVEKALAQIGKEPNPKKETVINKSDINKSDTIEKIKE